jgi:hypothetical protein
MVSPPPVPPASRQDIGRIAIGWSQLQVPHHCGKAGIASTAVASQWRSPPECLNINALKAKL